MIIIRKNFYSNISFGFLFDIDGVFLKGRSIIPEAKQAFNFLLDRYGKWKVPAVFVTNAGNKLRKEKASDLSEKFKLFISPDQVVMSHSPLRMFTQFHSKYVLVCGQGPVKEIATKLGFTKVITIDELRHQFPNLDVCDHNRKKLAPCAFERYNKAIEALIKLFGFIVMDYARPHISKVTMETMKVISNSTKFLSPYSFILNLIEFSSSKIKTTIRSLLGQEDTDLIQLIPFTIASMTSDDCQAIVLFGEPCRWESNLQILLDVLLTNGQPYQMLKKFNNIPDESGLISYVPYPHIPLLACNMDMQWMAEAPLPRLGHGCFLLALESLYEKLSSRKLLYTALIGKPSELTYHYAEYRLNKVAQDFLNINNPIKHIYCVGDNPQTDIYGANLYNRYLEAQQGSRISEEVAKARLSVGHINNTENHYIPYTSTNFAVNSITSQDHNCSETTFNNVESQYLKIIGNESVIKSGFAERCESILVLTGVIRKDNTMDINSLVEMMSQSNVNHNHRDFPDYPQLKVPTHVVHSVDEAVLYAYDKEKFRF